ncbi:deoxycytidylate deaminase [Rhizobium azibense]|uniref:dCMP deaminase n=1 Tax=Rhizobium azibense TaxID=1136135 RepID=A0A4R3RIA9_9HYPH|nr:dCMP deaminase family protein [Rhizobium azibense]TCU34119.1 dCMP deaminase [Rhizobium azibense]
MSWDSYFIQMSKLVASKSKDRSTKVGCVIVGPDNEVRSTGFNGFPRGIDDEVEARHERPAKYQWSEHAERNAIYNAARAGIATAGCRIFLQWFPCVDCARAIIQAGIHEVVALPVDLDNPRWAESFRISREMLDEAGVTLRYVAEEC